MKVSLTPEETDTELADRIAITILPPNIFNNYQVAKNLSKVVVVSIYGTFCSLEIGPQ